MLKEQLERLRSIAYGAGSFTEIEALTRQLAMLEVWDRFRSTDFSDGVKEFEKWLYDQCVGDFRV